MSNPIAPRSLRRVRVLPLALVVLAFAVAAAPAAAQEEFHAATPPRLSLIDGEVSFWPSGADAWEAAQPNLPLGPGDHLATGSASRLELEVGSRAFLRVAAHAELGVTVLDPGLLAVMVNAGRVTLDVRSIDPGARVELRTPHAALRVTAPGLYDVRVDPERSRFTAHGGSGATVDAAGATMILVSGFEIVTGAGFAQPARYDAPAEDDWIHWNRERSDRIVAAASRAYVPEGVYGVYDLDRHGSWRHEPDYGHVWVPARVPATWAPYTTGRWVWHGVYGWSWVDAQPWGWAPFHYGRWVRLHSYWAWAPGPVAVRPVYAPALVAFLTPPVGVVVGTGPFVSWVALGWGEPVLPWWGPTWYRGRPCWRGWGGPTIINEKHIHIHPRRGPMPHHEIRRYRNQKFPDAVVGVHRRDFDRRSMRPVHFRPGEQERFRPGRDVVPPDRRRGGPHAGPRASAPPRPEIHERSGRRQEPPGRRFAPSGSERTTHTTQPRGPREPGAGRRAESPRPADPQMAPRQERGGRGPAEPQRLERTGRDPRTRHDARSSEDGFREGISRRPPPASVPARDPRRPDAPSVARDGRRPAASDAARPSQPPPAQRHGFDASRQTQPRAEARRRDVAPQRDGTRGGDRRMEARPHLQPQQPAAPQARAFERSAPRAAAPPAARAPAAPAPAARGGHEMRRPPHERPAAPSRVAPRERPHTMQRGDVRRGGEPRAGRPMTAPRAERGGPRAPRPQ